MRRAPLSRLAPIALALALTLAPAGCSDDGGGDASDTSQPADTGAADTAVAGDTGQPGDTATPDDTATGGDTTAADTSTADTSPPDPNDPCSYGFTSNTSYMTDIALASLSDEDVNGRPADHCCFDFTADGTVDNKLGEIIALIQGLPQIERDVNTVMAANIADGTFTVLFEFRDMDSLQSDGDVTLRGFYGEDTDDDHADNLAGEGSFTANLSSFEPGTAQPRIAFTGVTLTNGNISAGPTVFRLEIPLANGLELNADILDTRFEGTIEAGPSGGVAIDGVTPDGQGGTRGAKLGGIIAQDELFGALNDFVDDSCACLNVAGGGKVLQKSDETWECASNIDKTSCSEQDSAEAMCRTLADACGLALAFVTPDIDTNDSGQADAFSLGFWLKATGATIVGVEPAACEQ